jgi:hypothetical protein
MNKHEMLRAGIPADAIATTLPNAGFQNIRDRIRDGSLLVPGRAIVVAPAGVTNTESVGRAELAFYLTMKELMLASKVDGVILSLAELNMMILEGRDTANHRAVGDGLEIYDLGTEDTLLGVSGFVANGESYIEPRVREFLSALLLKWMRRGNRIVFGCHCFASRLDSWWPPHLVAYIARNGDTFNIGSLSDSGAENE